MKRSILLEDLHKLALEVIGKLTPGQEASVIGLYGELGSGKTTFVQHIAKIFGVNVSITSPTFVIQKNYKLSRQKFDHLIHIDAYRLEDSKELSALGWKNLIKNPKNVIFIEWADKVEDILPENTKKIYFETVGEKERKVSFKNI